MVDGCGGDAFSFVTGEATRKGKNLAGDSRRAITTSSTTLPALDVIVEGVARKVTDEASLQRVADAYGSRMGWPLAVRDGAVFGPNAPTAGPPPDAVFELAPATVIGLPGIAGTEQGASIKRFGIDSHRRPRPPHAVAAPIVDPGTARTTI